MPIVYPYIQYGGIWTLQQQMQAQGAANWPNQSLNQLWSWGRNDYGQLGLNNITYYSSPKQVGALTSWTKLFKGGLNDDTLAIKSS